MQQKSLGHGLEATPGTGQLWAALGKGLSDSRNWPPLICHGWSRIASWKKQPSKGRSWKCFQTLTLSRSARPGRLKRVSSTQPPAQGPASLPSHQWVGYLGLHACMSLHSEKATAGSLQPFPPTSWGPLQGAMAVISVLCLPLWTLSGKSSFLVRGPVRVADLVRDQEGTWSNTVPWGLTQA